MRVPLLEACARIDGHAGQRDLVRQLSEAVGDWRALLDRAELEGVSPLLGRHLDEAGAACPDWVRRSLHLLERRHRQAAEIRTGVLAELLDRLRRAGLRSLVLKGSALAYTLYPDPALRPMRDIDLLLHRGEAARAHALLKDAGFTEAPAVQPADHFHLPPLYRRDGETSICIEIHRGLYPDCPPWYPPVDFDRLFETGRDFTVGAAAARTLAAEETLHYLYQHGFHAPLTFEPFKLINAADVIGFTEAHHDTLDWARIKRDFPLLGRALPYMHHLAPWDPDRVPAWLLPDRTLAPLPYGGWPHRRLKELKADGCRLPEILRRTFLPSRWWLGIYYGAATPPERLRCLLWQHPRHVFWWARLYRSLAQSGPDVR